MILRICSINMGSFPGMDVVLSAVNVILSEMKGSGGETNVISSEMNGSGGEMNVILSEMNGFGGEMNMILSEMKESVKRVSDILCIQPMKNYQSRVSY